MIPEQRLNIIPKNQYYQLKQLFDNIYQDWIIDQDEERRKYFIMFFNIIKKEVENMFLNKSFWIIYSMDYNYCTHINKKGEICNRRIDIKVENLNGKWKCYQHISKTIYKSKKRESLDIKDFCIGSTKYGKQLRSCKNKKWSGWDYCKIHLNISNPSLNLAFYNYYLNKKVEIDVLEDKIHKIDINYHLYQKDIIVTNDNNISVIPFIIKDVNLFYESKYNVLDIKFKNRICLEDNCYKNAVLGEDLCKEHVDEQQTITYYEIIDNDIDYYVYDILTIEKNILEDTFIDNIINIIDDNIYENKKTLDKYINNINIILNNYEKKNNNNIISTILSNNTYEIITNIIENKTYINITYLEKKLKDYNNKFKCFKKEIQEDFPFYYKRLKGYFQLMEEEFNYDIIRNIEIAKINSIFI